MFEGFYAVQCHKCKVWSVKEVRKISTAVFDCPSCGSHTKVLKSNKYGKLNIYGAYKTNATARNKCIQLNTGVNYARN